MNHFIMTIIAIIEQCVDGRKSGRKILRLVLRRQNIKWRNSIRWEILVRNGRNCIFPCEMHSASRDKITGNTGLSRCDSSFWSYRYTYICRMYVAAHNNMCRAITKVTWIIFKNQSLFRRNDNTCTSRYLFPVFYNEFCFINYHLCRL